MVKSCCKVSAAEAAARRGAGPKNKVCIRFTNKKLFTLPRKFSRANCLKGPRGFTMRASCAPYKNCKRSLKK